MTLDFNNNEFCTALDLIQETNESFFLTGKAGTGKSTFLKYIVEKKVKNYVVVAPTGIAAINVGGVTIHSFFQFPHSRPLLPDDKEIKVFWKNSERRKIVERMDTLIIDEISMVRVDLLDAIDYSLRRNGGNPNLPFGGKQVVFVGDVFQLEPVVKKGTLDEEIISEIWGGAYFYCAKVFEKVKLLTIELQQVYRQSDPEFITLLNKVRENRIEQKDIDKINSRVTVEADLKEKKFVITLTSTNEIANKENSKRLSELKSDANSYNAEVSGEFPDSKFPTEPEIILKVGAQIIFIKNDFEKRWVNGTIAEVSELTEKSINVKLQDGRIYPVEKQVWENYKYFYNRVEKKIDQEVIGTFKQYPLKLAWAITIHKSQGLTLDNVIIDIGNGIFASGQAYVALSRVTSFNGLFLKKKIHSTDIFVDDEIKDFAKSFNDTELLQNSLSIGRKIYQLQKNNNIEGIGEMYFDKAIESLIGGNFKAAFNELVQGFKNVTCDCHLVSLTEKYREDITISFKNNQINCTTDEWDFTRAVFYFFIDNYIKAQTLINSYLEENPHSEIGHYLNARIVASLGNNGKAVMELEEALALKKTSRVHYRLGRLKEDGLNQFGIHHLLQSILINPSSKCAYTHYWIKAKKRRIRLKDSFQKLIDKHRFDKNTSELNVISQDDFVELFGDAITYTLKGLNVYEQLQLSPQLSELTLYQKEKKWGYCDKNNRLIIDCIYDNALPFEGCVAAVQVNKDWGFINYEGVYIIPPGKYKLNYDYVKNGIYKEGRAGLLKSETQLYGFIDNTGKEVVPFIYSGLEPFTEGLALVYHDEGQNAFDLYNHIYSYGFINKNGKEVIPLVYSKAYSFSEELAAVKDKNAKCGFIDKEGKIAIPLIYEDVQPFSKGLAGVKDKNGKWGFISKTGNVVLPFIYDCINPFSDLDLGLYSAALVKLNEEWLYVDEKGKPIINWIVYKLRNYVIQQQERLGKQVIGVFVVPVFDREKRMKGGILPPKLNSNKVIYKTINRKESQLLVMSVDPLNYKSEDLQWEVPNKLDIKAAFINVQTSLIKANYKAGVNIGGYIKTKFSSGYGDVRNVVFGMGTNIPCICEIDKNLVSQIYCENLWIDKPEEIDISVSVAQNLDKLKSETEYDFRNRVEGLNILGGIHNIEPFIQNLSEIQSASTFGYINRIQGLSEDDYYFQDEINYDDEYDGGGFNDDSYLRSARDAIRGMDEETDGFWRDL